MTFIDALEQYSAEHPESIEELLSWPARRFEAFYESFSKRKMVDQLERRKLAMISGIHGNPNVSGDALGKAVQGIEQAFDDAVAKLYGEIDEEDESFDDNPFLSAMKLPEITTTDTYTEKGLPFEIERDHG